VTDRTKLQQILVNLLTNAVKFTPFGKVSVRAAAAGDIVQVSVIDTGIGIAPQDLERVFEEYGQVGNKTGSGLGLPISRRLARLLDGDLTVSSRAGWGSTFSLTIPRELVDPAAATGDSTGDSAIVVYANDPNEGYLVGKYLREADHPASVFEDARNLATTVANRSPRLAVVDVGTADGLEVLDMLVSVGAVVVAVGSPADRGRAFGRGAHAFVTRPVERHHLVRAVNRAVSGARPRLLVIDDEEDARDLMARMLARVDFDVEVASEGSIALERITANRPDLIVLDLMMPAMDGFEMVHQLSSREEWRDIPIILVTAKDVSPAERRALGTSVRRVMRKGDLNREEILAEIDRAVNAR
jgi:CheY-like chemotaxis protein